MSQVPPIKAVVQRLAQSPSGTTITSTAATVQTDKAAYLPASPVVASGSGWANGTVVTLTYTELSTTLPNGTLHPPVQVYASTNGSGSFNTAGDPNGTFTTDTSHDATVTLQVTAQGLDANGATVSVKSTTFTNGVTVATDDNKYALGQPMTIFGAGYTPGAAVSITIELPDHTTTALSPAPTGDGTFSVVYNPPLIPGRYKITATDGIYSAKTATTQADNIAVDFKQCANQDTTLGNCHWIGSILQKSNSRIFEGMSTLQRMVFDAIPASTNSGNYRMQFHMDALKATAHAYDFVTTWDTAIDATNELAPAPLTQPVPLYPVLLKQRTGAANALACADVPNSGQPPTLQDICLQLRDSANTFVTYADLDPTSVAGFDPVIGDNVNTRLSAYQDRYGIPLYTAAGKKHAIKFYSNAPIDSATFVLTGYDAQGNSNWQLNWHSTGTPTRLLVEFAAHIAVGNDTIGYGVGYGAGHGASNISGGPYHVSVDLFDFNQAGNGDDTSLGSQDNQLQGADILTPPSQASISTTPHNASHVSILNQTIQPGTVVHDRADVNTNNAAQLIPAGSTVIFHRFDGSLTCTGTPTDETVSVTAGSQTSFVESTPYTPGAGAHSYLADFVSGDTTKVLSKAGDPAVDCEPFSVQGTSTVATTLHKADHTTLAVNDHVALNSVIHDLATVTVSGAAAPTGSVDFRFYTSVAACTADTTFTGGTTKGSVALSATSPYVAHPSTDSGALTAGTYAFKAKWAGDSNYTGNTSDCEPFVVDQGTSTTTTTLHKADHSVLAVNGHVALNAIIHDLATVTVSGTTAPTGSVDFRFYTSGAACTADTGFSGGTTKGSIALTASSPYVAHPSSDSGALLPGTYAFKAKWAGDSNYAGSTSDCEPFIVDQGTSTVATTLHKADHSVLAVNDHVALNAIIHDLATVTVSSTTAPTGSVDFRFYTSGAACSADTTFSGGTAKGSIALSATSPYVAHPSTDSGALLPGTYAFKAKWAGDSNYSGNTSDCEPFVVDQGTSTTATTLHKADHSVLAVNDHVALNSIIHDLATVTVSSTTAPTGNVDFRFYTSGAACTADTTFSGGTAKGSIALTASSPYVAHPSTDSGALLPGTYAFKAKWAGDSNYAGSTSDCEPFIVDQGTSTVATTLHKADHSVLALNGHVALNSIIHDLATVTVSSTTAPSGSVDFRFYTSGAACTADTSFAAGTAKGSIALTATSPYVAHPSTDSGALLPGTYAFKAKWAGDSNYTGNTSDCEPFVVDAGTSALTTTLHKADHSTLAVNGHVDLGSIIHDLASLTVSSTTAPTGNIDFRFYATGAACAADTTFSGGATKGSVALTGTGPYVAHPSDDSGALAAGIYAFKANWAGDSNYSGATSDCEPFIVDKAPTNTVTTLHNGPVNDTANPLVLADNGNATSNTVHDSAQTTGQVGTIAITGNVTFRFYGTQSACAADAAFAAGTLKGTVTLAAGVAHPSDAATGLTAGYYAFKARYNGDGNYNASTSACEPFYVTTLKITKFIHGPSETFSYDVTGANTLNAGTTPSTNITPPADGSASFGPQVIVPGNNTIAEHTPLPGDYVLTDVSCTGYTGGGTGAGALDSNGVPVNWNFTAAAGNAVECTYVNSAVRTTRTQGFWATHTALANKVWNFVDIGLSTQTPLGVDATLCALPLGTTGGQALSTGTGLPDGTNEVMGGFWASISKLANAKGKNAQRSDLDQARMQMLQQYLAAVLNVHAFGSGSPQMLADARTAYCGTNLSAIQAQIGILGTFNMSGDSLPFTPGSSATPDASKAQANIVFWDNTYRKP